MCVALLAVGLALAGVARGQVCNPACASQPAACCGIPQADTFMAYEADSAGLRSGIFRGIVPNTAGATCNVTSDIDVIAPTAINGPLTPVSVILSPTVTLDFNLGEGVQRWSIAGDLGAGFCFTPEVSGFHNPHIMQLFVTDGCGVHRVSIGSPKFLCVTQTIQFVCFESNNLDGNTLPLPPGFDRPEDVCAVFS
jgi:hypothetical protein